MAATEPKPILDVLTLDQPEQLKALGHPLRLRVLETLGAGDGEHLTNRELANRLGVDPGHLHFHVRMLLRAGLIELAEGGQGREKPYRAVARTVRVAPALLKSDATSDLRAAMLDEVQRGWAEGGQGREKPYRAVARTVRVAPALLKSDATSDLRAAMLDEVQRGWAEHGATGAFRSAQVTARVTPEQAVELIQELVEQARVAEDPSLPPLVITTVLHPPSTVDLES
jgi:DNA-binding transcriptional ArsR family regulator